MRETLYCDSNGYEFRRSRAVVNGRFMDLALDQHLQHLFTDQHIDCRPDEVLPLLIDDIDATTTFTTTARVVDRAGTDIGTTAPGTAA